MSHDDRLARWKAKTAAQRQQGEDRAEKDNWDKTDKDWDAVIRGSAGPGNSGEDRAEKDLNLNLNLNRAEKDDWDKNWDAVIRRIDGTGNLGAPIEQRLNTDPVHPTAGTGSSSSAGEQPEDRKEEQTGGKEEPDGGGRARVDERSDFEKGSFFAGNAMVYQEEQKRATPERNADLVGKAAQDLPQDGESILARYQEEQKRARPEREADLVGEAGKRPKTDGSMATAQESSAESTGWLSKQTLGGTLDLGLAMTKDTNEMGSRQMVKCPYNKGHLMPEASLAKHMQRCPSRPKPVTIATVRSKGAFYGADEFACDICNRAFMTSEEAQSCVKKCATSMLREGMAKKATAAALAAANSASDVLPDAQLVNIDDADL